MATKFAPLILLLSITAQTQSTIYNLVAQEGDEFLGPQAEYLDLQDGFSVPSPVIMSPGDDVQPSIPGGTEEGKIFVDDIFLEANDNEPSVEFKDVTFTDPSNNIDLISPSSETFINVTANISGVSVDEDGLKPKEELIVARINYSTPRLNRHYRAKDEFNPRGMEHLYLITNLFLQLVNREVEMPPQISALVSQEVASSTLDQEQALRVVGKLEDNWDVLVVHYIGLVALVALGLLIAGTMPVVGLFFYCCRCAGRCGAEEPHYDKRRDPCKRATLGTFLATFVVIVLLGLVCAFVTNARMEEGVRGLPTDLEIAIHDAKIYINNTDSEVNNLFIKNYKELQEVLFHKLDSSGELVKSELARVTKAVAVDNLTAIASSLTSIKSDLAILRNTTHQLQKEKANLQNGLSDVAKRLQRLKEECESVPECQRVMEFAEELQISTDFSKYLETEILPQLPDVEKKLKEVSDLIGNNIEIKVKRGKRAFDHIATEIQNKVQRSIPDIKDQIKNAGKKLEDAATTIHKFLHRIDPQDANQYIEVLEDHIDEYARYRYWAFFALCMVLLLITLCFTLGVTFGCCGRRPDETTSCHKTTGASWLMCGVGFTFFFSAGIMVVTTALFVAGSASEVLLCDPLRDPTHSEVFHVVEDQVQLEKHYPPGKAPLLTEIIKKCHYNESVYSVLSLYLVDDKLNELRNYRESLNLNQQVEKLKEKIKVDTKIEILSDEAKQQLRALADSSIARKEVWDYYTDILNQEVLTVNLIELAGLLNQTADQLPPNNASAQLTNDAIYLEGLQRWLNSIRKNTRILKETTARLNESLKFNKTSLHVAIQDLITQAEFAQHYLGQNGSVEILALVDRFTQEFFADVDDYVNHVDEAVGQDVGRCGPMSTVYNATASAVCKDILYPFNGFWSSVGWCFFFFIPCMILSVHLASLYRKTEPYPGPLTESHESMYDAYAERDNIPLTSGYDKKARRRSRDYEPGHVGQSYSASEHAPRTSPPRNFESSDWIDFPPLSGGPPRYTSQPSLSPEYERPPPYYYPGPGPQYYGGPPSGQGPAAGGLQVHPPPPGPPTSGPVPPWNTPQRTINIGGWKISPAYTRDEYDA